MTTDKRFDEMISGWLEETAPARLPERVLEATFELTRRSRQRGGWHALLGRLRITRAAPVLGGAVVVVAVMVAALALDFYDDQPAFGGPVATDDPRYPFLGIWVSTTDADGGTQAMTVRAAQDGAVEIVVTDDVASVCSGTPSTMTGTARLEGSTHLVIPAPDYTCDDGSEPQALSGPPLAEQLRDWSLLLDPDTETLTDNFGGVWLREGAEVPSPGPLASGAMWPQSNLDEVRAAQERADAGDPDYTWQTRALVEPEGWVSHVELELVDRFIHEVLGWETYLFNEMRSGDASGTDAEGWPDGTLTDQRYVRCAPGRMNPLYPPQPDSEQPGESCAPTLDDLNYESVSLDLAQLDRQGRDGIWVVNRWQLTAPFAQVDPTIAEAQGRERLEEFLAARIAGNGAEGYVQFVDDVPLLYATTAGAPYERFEIERLRGPRWPYGGGVFRVRLFADGDATVVEQAIRWDQSGGLGLCAEVCWSMLDGHATTEDGRPIVLFHTSSDGEVTVSAPSTWKWWLPGKGPQALDVWFGALWRLEEFFGGGERVEFVDPVAYDAWCAENGGSPLLSAPADAAAIAQQVIADPDFETTAPVAARIGGLEAVSIDVTLATGGKACGVGGIEISRWIHGLWEPGWRLRLYLVDLPQGMSVETLAITVVAPEERFEEVIAETAPIIESIEFHPR